MTRCEERRRGTARGGRTLSRLSLHLALPLALAACAGITRHGGVPDARGPANRTSEDWRQFRGPGGQGHVETTGLPLRWSETDGVDWKTAIPGKGWSSPVIEDGEIWMTTAIESPISEEEKARRLEGTTNNQPLSVAGHVSLRAVCVDKTSGELLHDVEVLSDAEPQPIHTLNSFASPTPVIEDGRLYCHFGTHGTACLDTRTREVVWRNQDLRLQHENGPGSSPIVWGDHVIFHCDGSDVQYVAALDKRTGKLAWKTDRSGEMRENPQLRKAYGTPLVVAIASRPHLISPGADWLYSYDPSSGREHWKLSYGALGFSIVPRPVAGHGMIYMCTSFMRSELLAIPFEDGGKPMKPRIAWRFGRQVPKMSSPILVGGEIYFVSDNGIATCLDARSGDAHWTERLGGNYSASPVYADGRIYFFSREGVATVIRAGTTFEKLAENRLDGMFMASAAADDGALFLRTDKALYRIDKAPGK